VRILAVDPGEKNIGIAISDPTGTIASPLVVIKHISRPLDAATIADLAHQNQVGLIVIGKSLDEEGASTPQSRRADHLAEAIHQQSELPVQYWDESFSTQEARTSRIALGTSRKKRRGHLDDLAAAVILQSYLDANVK
jgi:putative Holliday junction resolvase